MCWPATSRPPPPLLRGCTRRSIYRSYRYFASLFSFGSLFSPFIWFLWSFCFTRSVWIERDRRLHDFNRQTSSLFPLGFDFGTRGLELSFVIRCFSSSLGRSQRSCGRWRGAIVYFYFYSYRFKPRASSFFLFLLAREEALRCRSSIVPIFSMSILHFAKRWTAERRLFLITASNHVPTCHSIVQPYC